jgi:ActR/RegA family two-component response regulator
MSDLRKVLYSSCPYIILSGYHKIPEIEEALEQGLICNYLQKPYEVNEIADSINQEIRSFAGV